MSYHVHFWVVGLVITVVNGVVHFLHSRIALCVSLRLGSQFIQNLRSLAILAFWSKNNSVSIKNEWEQLKIIVLRSVRSSICSGIWASAGQSLCKTELERLPVVTLVVESRLCKVRTTFLFTTKIWLKISKGITKKGASTNPSEPFLFEAT